MTKPRNYEHCTECGGRAILAVEEMKLCYGCIVCALYADTDTAELAEMLGRPARAIGQMSRTYGIYKSDKYRATHLCGRIQPGAVPPNKGLRRPGYAPGRMAETQFRKGNRPHSWKPMWSERISKDGYLEIKVREREGLYGNWSPVHILLWEDTHGAVPAGHCLAFKNRNHADISLSNLELLPRGELMRRNTIHRLPLELKQVISLTGALKRALRRLYEKQNVGLAQPSL